MKRLYTAVCVGLIILLAGAFCLAQDFSEIEAILARVDAQTSFDTDFSAVMTMIVEDPEQGIAKNGGAPVSQGCGRSFSALDSGARYRKRAGLSFGGG